MAQEAPRTYSREEVARHASPDDAWIAFRGNPLLPEFEIPIGTNGLLCSCTTVRTVVFALGDVWDDALTRCTGWLTGLRWWRAGVVYDVTDFLEQHVGDAWRDYLGQDVSAVFVDPEIHAHTAEAIVLLDLYRVGRLVPDSD